MTSLYSLQGILDEAVQQLGKVTQDKARYEQVLKGLIMQVRLFLAFRNVIPRGLQPVFYVAVFSYVT